MSAALLLPSASAIVDPPPPPYPHTPLPPITYSIDGLFSLCSVIPHVDRRTRRHLYKLGLWRPIPPCIICSSKHVPAHTISQCPLRHIFTALRVCVTATIIIRILICVRSLSLLLTIARASSMCQPRSCHPPLLCWLVLIFSTCTHNPFLTNYVILPIFMYTSRTIIHHSLTFLLQRQMVRNWHVR